jgi:hypothetical protein
MMSPLHHVGQSFFKKASRNARQHYPIALPWLSFSNVVVSSMSSTMLDASGDVREAVSFPSGEPQQPVMLDSKEHVVGYLSKILNARVYDAAIETDLQLAKNLSTVRVVLKLSVVLGFSCWTPIAANANALLH